MRIIGVFLNPEVRTGGHRRYLEFFQAAADKGHKICLILNKDLKSDFHSIEEIRLKIPKKRVKPYSIIFAKAVKNSYSKVKEVFPTCDYVVIHGETHLFAGIKLKKLYKNRLLFALRSNGVVEAQMKKKEKGNSLMELLKLTRQEYKYREYEIIISKESDIIAFQSSFDRDSFLSRNKKIMGKTVIVPGNIGGDWFNPDLRDRNSSNSVKNLLYLGALNRRKGVGYLIDAVIELNKKGYNLNLVLLGIGNSQKELESKVVENSLGDKIIFKGRVNNPLDYVVKSDLVIVPSVFDSFPDVILESLHVGTPVIAAESGGMPYMLDSEDIFNVADSNAIYNKIKNLIDNPTEYKQAQARVLKNRERFNFDWADAFLDEMKSE